MVRDYLINPECYESELKNASKSDEELAREGWIIWKCLSVIFLILASVTFTLYFLSLDKVNNFTQFINEQYYLTAFWFFFFIIAFPCLFCKPKRIKLTVTNNRTAKVTITGDSRGQIIEISAGGSTRSITKEEALDIMRAGKVTRRGEY